MCASTQSGFAAVKMARNSSAAAEVPPRACRIIRRVYGLGMNCNLLRAFLIACLLGPAVLPAQTKPATPPGKSKTLPKQEEEEGKIDGIVLNRDNGTFLGLTLVQGKFRLTFYDKKKKKMPVDVARAAARWPNVHGPGDNRTVLNPAGDGTYLEGAQFVRGPYAFRLFLTLIKDDSPTSAVENFSLAFHD